MSYTGFRAHCWKGRREHAAELYGDLSAEHLQSYDQEDATCMLWAMHDGPHEWTPDSQITITFSDTTKASDTQ